MKQTLVDLLAHKLKLRAEQIEKVETLERRPANKQTKFRVTEFGSLSHDVVVSDFELQKVGR